MGIRTATFSMQRFSLRPVTESVGQAGRGPVIKLAVNSRSPGRGAIIEAGHCKFVVIGSVVAVARLYRVTTTAEHSEAARS